MTMTAKVLENEAVLNDTHLFLYLSSEDLLHCRLVCTTWRTLCSKILRQRQSLQLTFQGPSRQQDGDDYHDYQKYCSQYEENLLKSKLTLSNLTECLKTSDQFPCVHFTFYGGNLGCTDVQNFLEVFGPQIKSLNFDLKALLDPINFCEAEQGESSSGRDSGSGRVQILQKILQSKAPNVESISIFSCHVNAPHPLPPFRPLPVHYRPHLNGEDEQRFVFNKIIYHNILKEVIQSSKNLKNFPLTLHLFRDREIMEIFNGSFKTIEKLHVDTYDINTHFDAPFFEKLTQLEFLPVKKIDISMHSYKAEGGQENGNGGGGEILTRNCQVISTILEKVKKTAKQVKVHSFPRYIDGLNWPRLERVTKVCFYLGNAQDNKNFCQASAVTMTPFRWSETFPLLKNVEVDSSLSYSWDAAWENNFLGCHTDGDLSDPSTVGMSVRRLRIGYVGPGVCLENWLDKFCIIFPNLEDLELTTGNFSRVSQSIWQFKRLRKLDLTLPIGNRFLCNKFVNIDAAFTGFSEQFCTLLAVAEAGDTNGGIFESTIEEHRVKPSILNLQQLKLLELYFCGCVVPSVRIMSLYAFKLMPDLRVKISYCGI